MEGIIIAFADRNLKKVFIAANINKKFQILD